MSPQPVLGNRSRECGSALIRCAAGFEERTVDQLDKYAAVLNGLDRVGDINQLEGGSIEIS